MPTTMGHLSTERAEHDAPKLLTCGDHFTGDFCRWLTGIDLVNVGDDYGNPVEYPYAARLLAQLNTGWVPRIIMLQDWCRPGTFPDHLISEADYDAAWLNLVTAAQTSTARVVVLPHPVVDTNSTVYNMLHALPVTEWLDLLPFDSAGPVWYEATQKAQASIISDLVFGK